MLFEKYFKSLTSFRSFPNSPLNRPHPIHWSSTWRVSPSHSLQYEISFMVDCRSFVRGLDGVFVRFYKSIIIPLNIVITTTV